MTWTTLISEISKRFREPKLTAISGKNAIPYFLQADIEEILWRASQQLLREVPIEELKAFGSAAVINVTSASGSATIPLNVIGLLGAAVDDGPTSLTSLSGYHQKRSVDPTILAIHAFTSDGSGVGKIVYTGTNLTAEFLIEPSLASFQADDPIFPPGYDEERISRTLQRMLIMRPGV